MLHPGVGTLNNDHEVIPLAQEVCQKIYKVTQLQLQMQASSSYPFFPLKFLKCCL